MGENAPAQRERKGKLVLGKKVCEATPLGAALRPSFLPTLARTTTGATLFAPCAPWSRLAFRDGCEVGTELLSWAAGFSRPHFRVAYIVSAPLRAGVGVACGADCGPFQ